MPTNVDTLNEILARVKQIQRIIEGQYVSTDGVMSRGNSDWPAVPMPTMEEMVKLAHDPQNYTPAGMRDPIHP